MQVRVGGSTLGRKKVRARVLTYEQACLRVVGIQTEGGESRDRRSRRDQGPTLRRAYKFIHFGTGILIAMESYRRV